MRVCETDEMAPFKNQLTQKESSELLKRDSIIRLGRLVGFLGAVWRDSAQLLSLGKKRTYSRKPFRRSPFPERNQDRRCASARNSEIPIFRDFENSVFRDFGTALVVTRRCRIASYQSVRSFSARLLTPTAI